MSKELRPVFAVGTGRCGTRFLYELIRQSKQVTAFHEQAPLSDAFLRYLTWYQLPIDARSCWTQKEAIVETAGRAQSLYFESSAYLSLNILDLRERFDAKIIVLIRDPRAVVESYYRKGWYEESLIRENPSLAPAIQPGLHLPHHHFSRICGYGEEGETWDELTQVGKLAWYWTLINQRILDSLSSLSATSYRIIRIEDFDYDKYLEVAGFLALEKPIKERTFARIAKSKANQSKSDTQAPNWTKKEEQEFRFYVSEVAEEMGYKF